jgi:hypothetical protein
MQPRDRTVGGWEGEMRFSICYMTSWRGRTEGGFNRGHSTNLKAILGWDSFNVGSWNITPETREQISEIIPMTENVYRYRGSENRVLENYLRAKDDLCAMCKIFGLDNPCQIVSHLNIQSDRNGFYFEDKTFHRKRYKRLRFNNAMNEELKESWPVGEVKPKPYRKCNCCGFSSVNDDDWNWSISTGLLSSGGRYISSCKACGAKKKVGKLHDFTGDFSAGSVDGKLEIINGYIGDPIIPFLVSKPLRQ